MYIARIFMVIKGVSSIISVLRAGKAPLHIGKYPDISYVASEAFGPENYERILNLWDPSSKAFGGSN